MEDFYRQVILHYGKPHQITKSIEELNELSTALARYLGGNHSEDTLDNIAEEIADVKIMLGQLQIIFDNCERVQAYKREKRIRTIARIAREENGHEPWQD